MKYLVSAIVPAYNEEKKIRTVLKTLLVSKDIDEVICVDDGSTDKTIQIAESLKGVRVIHLPKNKGKAYAISVGIQHATGSITLFIDADINGFTTACIKKLLLPLFTGQYDATIGYRLGKFERLFFRPLGGERAYFKKDLMPYLKKFEKKGYGLEIYLNNLYKKRRVKPVELAITNTWKHKKQSYPLATKLTLIVVSQVLQEMVRQQATALPITAAREKLPKGNFHLPLRKTTQYAVFVSLLVLSGLLTFYTSASASDIDKLVKQPTLRSYEGYKKMLLTRVVDPVKDSMYFKEMVENPIRQLQSSASGLTTLP